MKRFLRAGERYALSRIKKLTTLRNFSHRKASLLCIGLFFVCLKASFAIESAPATNSRAVSIFNTVPSNLLIPTDSIQPLRIGDTVPEYLWTLPLRVVNHPEGKETITLADYRGKLIILDFWATYCSACIYAFERLDFLSQYYNDRVHFLLVNVKRSGDTGDELVTFFDLDKSRHPHGFPIASVFEDDHLHRYFPHQYIPHYVWINMDGVVEKTTKSSEIDLFSIGKYIRVTDKRKARERKPMINPQPKSIKL